MKHLAIKYELTGKGWAQCKKRRTISHGCRNSRRKTRLVALGVSSIFWAPR